MKSKTNGVEFVEPRLNAAKASAGWRAPRPNAFVPAVYTARLHKQRLPH